MPSDARPPLHHEEIGDGPPLVLVHGWSLSSAAFADEARLLARARRVISPDLPGHGRSAPAPFTLAGLATDLASLADRLALEDAILVGWSLGAQVVLAALPLLRGRVSGAVLVSGTPRFTNCEEWPHGLPAPAVHALARRVRREPARAFARFFEGMFADGELGEGGGHAAAAAALGVALPPPDPACALAGLELLLREDLRDRLPCVDVPVLVVHGERDPICPAGAARAMAAAIPDARLSLVPGAGHAPFLSRPGSLAEATRPFLAACA